jgi:putative endopeptidase
MTLRFWPRPSNRLLRALAALATASYSIPVCVQAQTTSTSQRTAGIDRAGMDLAVKPGDNFYAYANGGWMKATEIPADRAGWGVFSILAEENLQRTHALLEETVSMKPTAGTELRKVADFYVSYMDEAGIESQGLGPIKATLARISSVDSPKELSRLLGEQLRADVDPLNATNFHTDRLFGLWVSPDFNSPTHYAPYLLQGGLGLPDRAYYVDAAPRMADIRTKYQTHIATVLTLAGIPDAAAKAARILAFEAKMAKVHATREESSDVLKANNPWKPSEFSTRAPGLEWPTFFTAAGLEKQPMFIVWQPAAVSGLAALVAGESLSTWREYLIFHALDRWSGVLPRAFVDERFAFYGKALRGTPELSARWKRAVTSTNGALGDAIGQLYVKRYFPPEAKAQVQALVKNIIAAFAQRIDRLDWMAPQTKAKAKEKLSTLYVGVGYPEHWIDYAGFAVVRGDAFGNAERSELFEYHRRLAELGRPVDTTEWWMTPQTVNAVNLPLQNALNFPAAILRPPFFDPGGTAAINYGGIGSTIGHEISHSFDDEGSRFDAHGRLVDWWTPEDLAHFKASGAQLAAQFDAYHPFPDLAVHGKQTLSENIADLAGLSATHDAWQLSLEGKPAAASEGFTGEQQFFLSFGQVWRGKTREPALRQQIVTDGHAPGEYRADTVRNVDAWYPAFDVQSNQTLYLPPKDRVRIW